MNFLRQSKFSTKLLSAFILCALITLAVGGLGMTGVTRLASALELTFSNNLVSVGNTNETLTSLTAHNRGLYRLLDAQSGGVPEADKNEFVRRWMMTWLAPRKCFLSTGRRRWKMTNVLLVTRWSKCCQPILRAPSRSSN